MFLLNYLLHFDIIRCRNNILTTLSENNSELTKNEINLLKELERKKKKSFKGEIFYSYVDFYNLPENIFSFNMKRISKCHKNSKVTLINHELDKLNFREIFKLSYVFYHTLLNNDGFLNTCVSIGINPKEDLPPKEVFRNFIVKFILRENFRFRKTEANFFIQSIAWIAHKHIVEWSKTHLSSYMFTEWSDVWISIANSISIKTDRYCFWRVASLFNEEELAEINKQISRLEYGEELFPVYLKRFKEMNPILFNQNVSFQAFNNPNITELLN